jgi:hypothetical protein
MEKKEITMKKQIIDLKASSFMKLHTQGMGIANVFDFVKDGKLKSRKILESECKFRHFSNDGSYLRKRLLSKLKYIDLDWGHPLCRYRRPANSWDTLFFEDPEDNFIFQDLFTKDFVKNKLNKYQYFDGSIYLLYDVKSNRIFWYLWFD